MSDVQVDKQLGDPKNITQKDKDPKIVVVKKEDEIRLEPMSFRDGKLHWHQPMESGDSQKGSEPSSGYWCRYPSRGHPRGRPRGHPRPYPNQSKMNQN